MKRITILLICFGFLKISIGQEINPQLISSCGEHFENDSYQLSWSLGECAISTIDGGNYILTQGFHQSTYEISTSSETTLGIELNIKVYPNPTSNLISIDTDIISPSELTITDLAGKVFLNKKMNSYTASNIDVSDFANGVYLIKIKDQLNHIFVSKFVKN